MYAVMYLQPMLRENTSDAKKPKILNTAGAQEAQHHRNCLTCHAYCDE